MSAFAFNSTNSGHFRMDARRFSSFVGIARTLELKNGGRGRPMSAAGDGRRKKRKKNSEESGVVGKQINSSVGWSRVFSGVTPNICFAAVSGFGALRNIHRPEAAEKSLETRRTVRETSYWQYESRHRFSQQPTPPAILSIAAFVRVSPPFVLAPQPRSPDLTQTTPSPAFDSRRSCCQEYAGNSSIMNIITRIP